ncbi:hypothetical protein ACOSP7_024940 [Xanthoceras sorbifolium]
MEGADHDHHQPTPAVNPEEVVITTSSEEPVRSYDCTFCKRGFSNAQALGGHMNIHRKDKAKLKQQATASPNKTTTATTDHPQNQQSFDVSKIRQSYSPPIPTNRFPSAVVLQPSILEAAKAKRAWNTLGDHQDNNYIDATKTNKTAHVVVSEVKQPPLFVEIPLMISGDDDRDHDHHHNQKPSGNQVHERVSSSSSSGSFSELDLELRLGPEPQESPSATGTKKFF